MTLKILSNRVQLILKCTEKEGSTYVVFCKLKNIWFPIFKKLLSSSIFNYIEIFYFSITLLEVFIWSARTYVLHPKWRIRNMKNYIKTFTFYKSNKLVNIISPYINLRTSTYHLKTCPAHCMHKMSIWTYSSSYVWLLIFFTKNKSIGDHTKRKCCII